MDHPLFSTSLNDVRIKDINNMIDMHFSYSDLKKLLHYLLHSTPINVDKKIVEHYLPNGTVQYRVLFQVKLQELPTTELNNLNEHIKTISNRHQLRTTSSKM